MGSNTDYVAVNGELLRSSPDVVTILAQSAERAETIDLARAQAAKARAEQRLQNNDGSNDDKRANLALKRAINRIQIAEMR